MGTSTAHAVRIGVVSVLTIATLAAASTAVAAATTPQEELTDRGFSYVMPNTTQATAGAYPWIGMAGECPLLFTKTTTWNAFYPNPADSTKGIIIIDASLQKARAQPQLKNCFPFGMDGGPIVTI